MPGALRDYSRDLMNSQMHPRRDFELFINDMAMMISPLLF